MKATLIIISITLSHLALLGQSLDTLYLFDCYDYAKINHPVYKQKDFLTHSYQLKQKNLNTNWLPDLNFHAQATYQSDVPHIGDIEIPTAPGMPTADINIPMPSKDQYKMVLEINQTIYDGGATKKSKILEEKYLTAEKQKVEVTLNQVKSTINDIYFSLMLLDKKTALINLSREVLNKRKSTIHSAIENGTMLPSNLDIIEAEILETSQNLNELRQQRKSLIHIMQKLTDTSIAENAIALTPDMPFNITNEIQRPELVLFDLQKASLAASADLLNTKRLPKLFAFSQAGYGKPGLNMLDDEFNPYYIIGAGIKWNIWDWNTIKRKKETLNIQSSIIETEKAHFSRNTRIALEQQAEQIANYESLIQTDKEIIIRREKITRSVRSQLDNGVINATEFITELNKEKQAKIQYETHKIQLIKAKINYLTLNGML